MDASKSFDAYEVIGVITPGSVVALMLALQWPEFRTLLGQEGLSVGGLGVFVVAAFELGHLVQGIGNILDNLFWALPGLPSAWVRSPRQRLLSPDQRMQLESKVAAMEPGLADLAAVSRTTWRGVTARIYSRVNVAGRSGRIDVCNRTYGLSRGLAAAFGLSALWLAYAAQGWTPQVGLAAALTLVAVYRMVRSGIHYARTLFVTFVDLS